MNRYLMTVLITCLVYAAASNAAQPNVLFILTDDQGYGDLSVHGNPRLKTPNLDKLHEASIRFTDFHVAPMCTPTRGELLTGQQAFRNGAVYVCQGKSMIRRGIPTAADMFKAGGYATGHFGKWHLGDNYPYRPQDRGFEETVHHGAWGVTSMADHWNNDYYDDIYEHNGVRKPYKGYCTDVWFNEAMKWMARMQKEKKPFFCYLPTNVPHVPTIVDQKYSAPYDGNRFLGMIAQFDENMGRIESFLKESGLRENTILIFMTDNGTSQGHRIFNAGMRGHKTQYYDGGHRVPFFIRWPAAGLDKPRDIGVLTHSTDVLPTLLDLCGLKKPADAKFDGFSLKPLIDKKTDKLPDRKIVIKYHTFRGKGCVLWKKWRLVKGVELYNITTDPGQRKNVAKDNPEILKAMLDHYEKWREEMTPLQKQINTISIGVPTEPETFLCSANWIGSYADSWVNIRRHGRKNGYWDLQVEESADYLVEVYGWPKDAGVAFNERCQVTSAGKRMKQIGRPVAKVKLKVGDQELTKTVAADAEKAEFTITLTKGDKTRLQTFLSGAKGEDLGGSYFVYVTKCKK